MTPTSLAATLPAPPKREHPPKLLAPRLLVIEDDSDLLPILARVVHAIDPELEVDWATHAEAARSAVRTEQYRAILSDYLLADSDTGLVLYRDCTQHQPEARFAMMSALPISLPSDSCQLLRKPFTLSECQSFLAQLLRDD